MISIKVKELDRTGDPQRLGRGLGGQLIYPLCLDGRAVLSEPNFTLGLEMSVPSSSSFLLIPAKE